MSRVRVTHTFDLKNENHEDATRDEIDFVVGTMSVQVEEPVIGCDPDTAWDDREGYLGGPYKVDVIPLDNVRDPVAVALEQFWSTIADLHPHITTGDLDPGTRVNFDRAATAAVSVWKRYNNPQPNTYALANPYPVDPA